jgi:hypothetical protein
MAFRIKALREYDVTPYSLQHRKLEELTGMRLTIKQARAIAGRVSISIAKELDDRIDACIDEGIADWKASAP